MHDTIIDYLSHCHLERDNGQKWIKWKRTTLDLFTAFARANSVTALADLHPHHLSTHLQLRAAIGNSKPTLNRVAVVIRAWARWAERAGLVSHCPLSRAMVSAPQKEQKPIPTFATLQACVCQLPADCKDAGLLLLQTGCRRSEILCMTWPEVDFQSGLFFIPGAHTKSGKPRAVPLTEECLEILRKRRQNAPKHKGPFLDDNGNPLFHPDTITKRWRKTADRLELYGVRLHDLRHAFVTRCINDLKADPVTVQHVVGHASLATTQGYAHPNSAHAQQLKALWDKKTAV